MAEVVRVDPEQLMRAAAAVSSSADDVSAGHASAVAAAEAAQPGLVGQSGQAIAAIANAWRETSTALHHTMSSQSEAVANCAHGYVDTEDHNAATIRALAGQG